MSGLPLFFMVKVIDTDFNMLSITKREHCDLNMVFKCSEAQTQMIRGACLLRLGNFTEDTYLR